MSFMDEDFVIKCQGHDLIRFHFSDQSFVVTMTEAGSYRRQVLVCAHSEAADLHTWLSKRLEEFHG